MLSSFPSNRLGNNAGSEFFFIEVFLGCGFRFSFLNFLENSFLVAFSYALHLLVFTIALNSFKQEKERKVTKRRRRRRKRPFSALRSSKACVDRYFRLMVIINCKSYQGTSPAVTRITDVVSVFTRLKCLATTYLSLFPVVFFFMPQQTNAPLRFQVQITVRHHVDTSHAVGHRTTAHPTFTALPDQTTLLTPRDDGDASSPVFAAWGQEQRFHSNAATPVHSNDEPELFQGDVVASSPGGRAGMLFFLLSASV